MATRKIPPFGVRMPDDLKDWVKETAHKEKRTMNNMIVLLLEQARAAAGVQFGDQAPAAGSEAAAR